jgi:hypothetical protein
MEQGGNWFSFRNITRQEIDAFKNVSLKLSCGSVFIESGSGYGFGPAFQVNPDPDTDPDPGFWWLKSEEKKYS